MRTQVRALVTLAMFVALESLVFAASFGASYGMEAWRAMVVASPVTFAVSAWHGLAGDVERRGPPRGNGLINERRHP